MSLFVGRDVRRVLKLVKAGTLGVDATADLVLSNPTDYLVETSKLLYEDYTYRTYIEAALLASRDSSAIAALFGVEKDLIEFYASVYYDVFQLTVIQRLRLVELCEDPNEKNLKLWGVSQGLDFLAWRLGFKVEISPVEGMKALYSDSFFKAKEAFFNSNSAEASKEALKWAKQAFDSAKVLKSWVSDMDEASKELELALKDLNADNINFGDISNIYLENGEIFEETTAGADIEQLLKENASSEG